MPERRHKDEAKTLLSQIVAAEDRKAPLQAQRVLAEALERAERRGREMFAKLKESSG
jgi:hypothetical protein